MIGLLTIAFFWLLGRLDNYYQYRYTWKPIPLKSNPRYKPQDVSVIVCTVGQLAASHVSKTLRSWLACQPLEIIIVTPEQNLNHVTDLFSDACDDLSLPEAVRQKLIFATTPGPSKRAQTVEGLRIARGRIIASVDDHIIWAEDLLRHLLACFDDPTVGGAHPSQKVYIPPERQDDRVVTFWEAAAARRHWSSTALQFFVATKTTYCLLGATSLYRAEIVKDPEFTHAFLNEYVFNRGPLDIGDDCFITYWMLHKGWNLCSQNTPSREGVLRSPKRTSAFISQVNRWQRSGLVHFSRLLYATPWACSKPYIVFKILELLSRSILSIVQAWAWIAAFRSHSLCAAALFLFYTYQTGLSYAQFLSEYPYMWRHLWALVFFDHFYIVQDLYCLLTLRNIEWGGRKIPGKS
ncbi:glycosyltransferase like family 2-domain-containing protein [Xylariaceae sp. FL1272]|nr:glycosyltransferase like family 2-domain-containing protein [Xylariaceae sp. FL1272]